MPTLPLSSPGTDFSRGKPQFQELTWGEFERCIHTLARAVQSFRAQAVVGLVHGGVFVGGALAKALKVEFYPVRMSRRSRDSGQVTEASDEMPQDLKGQRVLVVDDVASSGDSLEFATRLARARGVKAVKTVALMSRPNGFQPDYTALETSAVMVFPWDYQDVVEDKRFGPQAHPPRRS